MICVVIAASSYASAHSQITQALKYADLIELRLDFWEQEHMDLPALSQLKSLFSIPMIFTLRAVSQGGNYKKSEEERQKEIQKVATLKPEYLDLESDLPFHFIESLRQKHPEIKIILSYHDFAATPADIESIYQKMKTIPASFYKIALQANCSSDALRLLSWKKSTHSNHLIVVSMGIHGQISRILGPIVGSQITYACLEGNEIATGQLPAKTLCENYQYRNLNSCTSLYGLIGDPIINSPSHITHNRFIRASDLNALYVKMSVTSLELPQFLPLAKELDFMGLSVTMPLKEAVLPYLDHVDLEAKEIGAVNTLLFRKNKLAGFNTDGKGALDAIEQRGTVAGKRIVLIGTGGAAKAIAYEARQRGAIVFMINRNKAKAERIAKRLGCLARGVEDLPQVGHEILINCTPNPLPIDPTYILPNSLVMDIAARPRETALLKYAKEKGCQTIRGRRMFVKQALQQYKLWRDGF